MDPLPFWEMPSTSRGATDVFPELGGFLTSSRLLFSLRKCVSFLFRRLGPVVARVLFGAWESTGDTHGQLKKPWKTTAARGKQSDSGSPGFLFGRVDHAFQQKDPVFGWGRGPL